MATDVPHNLTAPDALSQGPAWPVRLFKLVVALVLLGGVVLLAATAWIYPQLPDITALTHYQPKQPLRILSADGVQIGGFGTERRVYQSTEQIPQLMKNSLLAVEDARFYTHSGIDPISVARAAVSIVSGGFHHHTTGGTHLFAEQRTNGGPQVQGGAAVAAH